MGKELSGGFNDRVGCEETAYDAARRLYGSGGHEASRAAAKALMEQGVTADVRDETAYDVARRLYGDDAEITQILGEAQKIQPQRKGAGPQAPKV